MEKEYKTVKAGQEAVVVEKKSKFIGQACHAETEEEAMEFLKAVKKAHPQANHHVYAYILREENRMRYSDDGEPQKTAGLPVLEVLKGYPVTDTALVVVRYFGGTLLGTGGLVRAYTQTAQAALTASEISTVSPCIMLSLEVPYSLRDSIVKQIEQEDGKEIQIEYTNNVLINWVMLAGKEVPLLQALQEITKGEQVQVSDIFYAPF